MRVEVCGPGALHPSRGAKYGVGPLCKKDNTSFVPIFNPSPDLSHVFHLQAHRSWGGARHAAAATRWRAAAARRLRGNLLLGALS